MPLALDIDLRLMSRTFSRKEVLEIWGLASVYKESWMMDVERHRCQRWLFMRQRLCLIIGWLDLYTSKQATPIYSSNFALFDLMESRFAYNIHRVSEIPILGRLTFST